MDSAIALVEREQDLNARALTWPDRARARIVLTADDYCAASELLLGIKALRKEADDTFDEIIAAANRAHKTAIEKKRHVEAPLIEAERIVKDRLVAFDRDQARQQELERQRLEREAKERHEQEVLDRAAALEREGHEYGDDGCLKEAAQLVEEAIQAPPPPVQMPARATPIVSGLTYRSTWNAVVTDKLALVKFIAANPQYLSLLDPNMPALNAQARSLKAALRLPGVSALETRDVAARR